MEGKYHYKSMFFFVGRSMLVRRDQGAKRVYPAICAAGSKGYPVVNTTYKLKITLQK